MVAINYAKDIRVGEQPVKAAALGSYFVWPPLPERLFFRGQSLAYDFVRQRYGVRLPDDTIDYTTNVNDLGILTRASTATYWGPSGTLLEAAVDEARIQHAPVTGKALGLLVESSATNDFPGERFESRASDDPALITTVEDEKLPGVQVTKIEGADDDFEGFRDYRTLSTVPSSAAGAGPRRVSLLVKPSGSVRYMQVSMWGTVHNPTHPYRASVDLWELEANRTSSQYSDFYLRDVGDGWVFVSFTAASNSTYTRLSVAFGMDGQGATDYANWTPIPEGDEVLLAIPQHYADTREHVKTFIPTIDSPVTRAADNVSIDLSDVFNPDEGTLRITAQVPEGEVAASLGNMKVVSDSDEPKEYDLNYLSYTGNTVAQLGDGIFNKVEYFPAKQGESALEYLIRTLYGNGEQGVMYIPEPKVLGQQVLWQDVEGTVPVESDGDPVGLMLDLSGNDNHATQSVSGARPIYRTDGTLHWLEFDGVNDRITLTSNPNYPATFDVGIAAAWPEDDQAGAFRSRTTGGGYVGFSHSSQVVSPVSSNGAAIRVNRQPFSGSSIQLKPLVRNSCVGIAQGGTNISGVGSIVMHSTTRASARMYGYMEVADGFSTALPDVEQYLANAAGVTL